MLDGANIVFDIVIVVMVIVFINLLVGVAEGAIWGSVLVLLWANNLNLSWPIKMGAVIAYFVSAELFLRRHNKRGPHFFINLKHNNKYQKSALGRLFVFILMRPSMAEGRLFCGRACP